MSNFDDLVVFAESLRRLPEITSRAGDEVGKDLVERVVKRVRLGYGVRDDGGKKEKFEPLASSTVKSRHRLSALGRLFPGSKPERSHLTATGQMLDSVMYDVSGNVVVLKFSNPEAEKKAYYNDRGGKVLRPFWHLSDVEVKATERILQKALDEYIDNIASSL